jgi:hypothetical protein
MKHKLKLTMGMGLLFLFSLLSVTAHADRDDRDRQDRDARRTHPQTELRLDQRFHHDRYYPRSGHVITTLPPRYHRIPYHNSNYYYNGGIWYRPDGPRFVVVAPPIGIVVPILPAFYSTIWISGIPYYYANDAYYVWRPDLNGYMVTTPPGQINEQEPPLVADELFVYPAKGQTEQQQADDRYVCHRWGVEKTGYDPTQPAENPSNGALNIKREDYQRAMKACLEGRGYTVR